MAKILFHSGAHKTASSHLQYNLRLNKGYLKSKGIKYVKLKDLNEMGSNAIKLRRNISERNYSTATMEKYMGSKINEAISGYDFAILSYEGAFGDMNLCGKKTIYPDAEKLIKTYKQILKSHQVIPVFVTRNYLDFIFSSFKWQIEYGRTFSLSKYVEKLKLDKRRWSKIVKALEQTFTTPLVWTFEEYKKNPNRILYFFLNKFSNKNISNEELETYDKKRNSSSGKNIVKLHYTLNKFLDKKKYSYEINKRISKYLDNDMIVFGNLLLNCFDTDLYAKFGSKAEYEEEIKILKKQRFCNFLEIGA